MQVRDKRFWCPKSSPPFDSPVSNQVIYKNCVDPPIKEQLFQFLWNLAKEKRVDLGLDDSKMPNKAWMIIAISTLNPQHRIFEKSYKPEVRQRVNQAFDPVMDNSDGFFDNLVPIRGAHDRRAPRFTLATKEQRLEYAIAKNKEVIARQQKALAKKEEQRAQLKAEKIDKTLDADQVSDLMDEVEDNKLLIRRLSKEKHEQANLISALMSQLQSMRQQQQQQPEPQPNPQPNPDNVEMYSDTHPADQNEDEENKDDQQQPGLLELDQQELERLYMMQQVQNLELLSQGKSNGSFAQFALASASKSSADPRLATGNGMAEQILSDQQNRAAKNFPHLYTT